MVRVDERKTLREPQKVCRTIITTERITQRRRKKI